MNFVPRSSISTSKFGSYTRNNRNYSASTNVFGKVNIESVRAYAEKIPSSSPSQPSVLDKPTIDNENFNIFVIDKQIRDYLMSRLNLLPSLKHELEISVEMTSSSDVCQRIIACESVDRIRKTIRDLESTMEVILYNLRVTCILEQYNSISRTSVARSFVGDCSSRLKNAHRLVDLKRNFLSVVREYVHVKIPKKRIHKSMVCEECGSSHLKVNIDDDSIYTCGECFSEMEIVVDAPSFKDADRVNLSSKYTYTRKGHFNDAVKRYQGTQNVDPKNIAKVVDIIRIEMDHNHLTAERGLPNSVNIDHIHDFLVEKSLSGYYDDLNLLNNIITGEECPDISHLEDKIYECFDELEKALSQIVDETRVNSLNVDYKLYKILQHLGWKCTKSEFYILKTKNKGDEHDEKMKIAFQILGWEWIPTF